ncbi:eukaryotic translation initiation factor-related protein [Tanacetum coccineum]
MAKKKATMTLKDFHGGSIPSDLPLPSAPGVTVRPLNHTGLDRNNAWTNPMGRQDHRLRPGSAGAVRTYDDKTPFLGHNVQIGRNFDEDERKPLDGGSMPRRTVSDENIRGSVPVRPEVKVDYTVAGNVVTRPATTPVSQYGGSSYAARFSEGANVSSGRPTVSGPSPNAWGPRKAAVDMVEPSHASWSAPDAATKLAHASALEKVTSGRWLSNQNKQIDVEVIRHPEPEAKVQLKGNSYTTFTHGSTDVRDDSLAQHAGRSLAVNDKVPVSARDVPSYTKERGPTVCNDGVQVQQVYSVGTVSGSELHPSANSESTERPKLKLLPRSKPVETLEPLVAYNQTIPQSANAVVADIGNASYKGPGLAGPEDAHLAYERPRVNLKPRSQPLEPMERNTETARHLVLDDAEIFM